MSKNNNAIDEELLDAIKDLTRVILLVNGGFENKSDAIRKLSSFSIPPNRIATLLGMKSKDVSSALNKAKKVVMKPSDTSER